MTHKRLSRRQALQSGAGLVLSPIIIDLAGCSSGDDANEGGDPIMDGTGGADAVVTGGGGAGPGPGTAVGADDVLFGLYSSAEAATGADAVRAALADMDFSWLSRGDSVLLKVAANSGNPHPSTTSPEAIKGVAAELFDRGAGRVVVGEQSGVEWVRHTSDAQTFSSTEQRLETAGMLAAMRDSGVDANYFANEGFDAFFQATPPPGSHWNAPMMLPNVVREVDHIIYLPRLSSHVIAGYTTGHKLSVGWLREDSRNHLHHEVATFYEKYTEVNYCEEIRSRHRMTVTLAEAMLLDFGPDDGTVHVADPRIVIASQNLSNHDAVAVSAFLHANRTFGQGTGLVYTPEGADGINQYFVFTLVQQRTGLAWGPGTADTYTPLVPHHFERGLSSDRAMTRSWEILGGRPEAIRIVSSGLPPSDELRQFIQTHTEGTATFA